MHSLFRHKKQLSSLPKARDSFYHDKSNSLSERATRRLEDWKLDNSHVLKELFGKISLKKPSNGLKKLMKTPEPHSQAHNKNPYFEVNFTETLRKTDKSKHLAAEFFRVTYRNTQERLCESSMRNVGIDSSPRATPVRFEKIILKSITKPSKEEPSKLYESEPFSQSNFESMFRQRNKSLEVGKNFWVTTKIPTPKTKLLISKKFEDFYKKLNGHNRRIYKNSVDEVYKFNER